MTFSNNYWNQLKLLSPSETTAGPNLGRGTQLTKPSNQSGQKPQIRARPRATQAGLRQVWRHITLSTVLTWEEIPEEGG